MPGRRSSTPSSTAPDSTSAASDASLGQDHIFSMPGSKRRTSRARRSTMRSSRARRSTGAAPGRIARRFAASGRVARRCAASGRVLFQAQLQGASLTVRAPGRSLVGTQLQGASLAERSSMRVLDGRVLSCKDSSIPSPKSWRPEHGDWSGSGRSSPRRRGRMRPMLRCASLSSARSRKVRTVTGSRTGGDPRLRAAEWGQKWGHTVLASCDPSIEPPDSRQRVEENDRRREGRPGPPMPRLSPQSLATSSAPMKLIGFTCCAGCWRSGRLQRNRRRRARAGKAHHQPGMSCLDGADGRRQNRDRRSGDRRRLLRPNPPDPWQPSATSS